MRKLVGAVVREYGLKWFLYRTGYYLKLKLLQHIPIAEKLFEHRVSVRRVFDFELNTEAISSFIKELPTKHQESIISQAQDAMQGVFHTFSSIPLDYGTPIDWQMNPMTQFSFPIREKWYSIPDFDPVKGDVKVVWEASRFSQFVLLSRAFLLTNDAAYYHAFSSQLKDWLDKNPYSYGVNHKCGQEASIRLVNALLAASVFRAQGVLRDEDECNLKELISRSYRKVLSNFFYAHKCIKNNHTISELCGMIIGAWCCKDDVTVTKAFCLLEKEISEQFREDGGYIQYSFTYQRVALQVIGCIFRIAQLIGASISASSLQRIRNSTELLYQCQLDDGDVPNYGPNDGALFFPLTSCGYRDFRPIISLWHMLTEGSSPYSSGPWDEETLWLAPNQVIHHWMRPRQTKAFSDIGIYILRTNQFYIATYLNRFSTRPAHMDQLHVDLWFCGQSVLCDSGTFSYADTVGQSLALTAAHNTVYLPNTEQMCRKGPFFVYNWPISRVDSFTKTAFDGTMLSGNGYSHRRRLLLKETEIIVSDVVQGNFDHCEYRFHTPCPVTIAEGMPLLRLKGGWQCRLETTGEVTVEQSQRSLYYMRMENIYCICIRKPMVNSVDENTVRFLFERIDGNG